MEFNWLLSKQINAQNVYVLKSIGLSDKVTHGQIMDIDANLDADMNSDGVVMVQL